MARLRYLLGILLGAGLGLALPAGAMGPAAAQGANPETTPAPANRLDQILAAGVLRVGTTGDYKPFTYRRGHGDEFIGIDIELARELAQSLGVRLEVVPTSWPKLMQDFAADRFDVATGGISVTLERQRRAFFSEPTSHDGKTPIARCDSQARFQTLAQIDQPTVRLITNPGGTNERFDREHASHAQLIVYPDNVTIFERLVAGDADLMITDGVEARLQQHLHPQLCAVHPDAPFDYSEKAFLLPRDPVLKAYVDQWVHLARATGVLQARFDAGLAYPWGLEALREAIDQRLALSEDVAHYKWNTGGAIEDPAREARVLDDIKGQASALGLPPARAEAFFRAQIEASKALQRELFARWRAAGQGKFDGVPDLATTTRGRLDQLTPRLLHGLADNATILADPARRADVARALQPLDSAQVSAAAASQAIAPLLTP